MVRRFAFVVVLACVAGAPLAHAQERGTTTLTQRQREDERKAMSAFAAGRYQDALNLYADLYADFRDPIYLRNIGRCHYKLKRPEEAISSFQDYLARYKRISAAEREEVQAWIDEMKALQQPPPAPAAPVAVPAPAPAPVPAPAPAPPAPAPSIRVAAPPPAPAILTERIPPPADDRQNVTIRRIGVAALIAGGALAVAGSVFQAMSWSKFNSSKDGACHAASGGCKEAAAAIERRNTFSKVFFISAAAAGAAGGAMIMFFPVSEPTRAAVSGFGAGATVVF